MSHTEFTCIVCPKGCELEVDSAPDGSVAVAGNQCKRGAEWALRELTDPRRVLTTTVATADPSYPFLPVRSDGELPLGRLAEAMSAINRLRVTRPLACGDTVCADLIGLGVRLVATATMPGAEGRP